MLIERFCRSCPPAAKCYPLDIGVTADFRRSAAISNNARTRGGRRTMTNHNVTRGVLCSSFLERLYEGGWTKGRGARGAAATHAPGQRSNQATFQVDQDQGPNLQSRPQLHVRKTKRSTDAGRTFHRPRLQGYRIPRTAKQEVRTNTDANGRTAACTAVVSCKASWHQVFGRREHAPGQSATGRKADIKTNGGHAPSITLRRYRHIRGKEAVHLLKADNDEAYGRGKPAVEHSNFGPRASSYDWRRRMS
jgi:hypothetical protein